MYEGVPSTNNIPNPAEDVNSKSQKNKKRFALDTKGEKDYQKRSKYLANSDENLQNFMKDSVVKNEDGTPKVVYSGFVSELINRTKKQVISPKEMTCFCLGGIGLEPTTPCMSSKYSNRLS